MGSNLIVGLIFYLVPFLILLGICICCAISRENRRNYAATINRRTVPTPTARDNLAQQCQRENEGPPPPYTAQPARNFDESLPSYECATNKPL